MAQSIMDYIFRRLALDYLPFDERAELGIYTASERARQVETGSYLPAEAEEEVIESESLKNDAGDAGRHGPARRPRSRRRRRHRLRPAARTTSELFETITGHQRRRTAVPHLRHQDATERQLLRLRGLRLAPAAAAILLAAAIQSRFDRIAAAVGLRRLH